MHGTFLTPSPDSSMPYSRAAPIVRWHDYADFRPLGRQARELVIRSTPSRIPFLSGVRLVWTEIPNQTSNFNFLRSVIHKSVNR